MSTREALYDEIETLRNHLQRLAAENEELLRLLAQAETRVEDLEAALDSATERNEER